MAKEESLNLKRRYLFWLYKTTKDSLDRIDRKFTQLEIDNRILERLKEVKITYGSSDWQKLLQDFKTYIDKKEKDAKGLKFYNFPKQLKADYLFTKNKLRIIEDLIQKDFGKKELRRIKSLYEEQMLKRILEEREHK